MSALEVELPSIADLEAAEDAGGLLIAALRPGGQASFWPRAPLHLHGVGRPAPPGGSSDEDVEQLTDLLHQQVAWMRHAHRLAGCAFQLRSVTDVLTDTVIAWGHRIAPGRPARVPANDTRVYRIPDSRVFPEVALPVLVNGRYMCRYCDLAVLRKNHPDFLIEIDSSYNREAQRKLELVRDAGGIAIWIRWNGGRVTCPSGIKLISLTRTTSPLCNESPRTAHSQGEEIKHVVPWNTSAEPADHSARQNARYQVAQDLARRSPDALKENRGASGPRLRTGVVVTGHQPIRPNNPRDGLGAHIFEARYIAVPGNVVPVRPLVASIPRRTANR